MEPRSLRSSLKIGKPPATGTGGSPHYFFGNKFLRLIFFFPPGKSSVTSGLGIWNTSIILRTGGGVWFNPIPPGLCFPITFNSSFVDFMCNSPFYAVYSVHPTNDSIFLIGCVCGVPETDEWFSWTIPALRDQTIRNTQCNIQWIKIRHPLHQQVKSARRILHGLLW